MNDVTWKLIALLLATGVVLFRHYREKRPPYELERSDPDRSVLFRLYWQGPLANAQANKFAFWCAMIPMMMLIALLIFELADSEQDRGLSWTMYALLPIVVAEINSIRGPQEFVISPVGIYWKKFYPWQQLTDLHLQTENAGAFFYLKLPELGNQSANLSRFGPFTPEDRQRIETLIESYSETGSELPESAGVAN